MYKRSLINRIIFWLMIIALPVRILMLRIKKLEIIWNFDEDKVFIAKEANKTVNDGKSTGAGKAEIKWVEGISGKALEFSGNVGSGQWVEVPHSEDMNIRAAITMEAWVYPTTSNRDKRTIITKVA